MANLIFVVKTFFLALVVVLLLQIRVGERTIDENIYAYMQTSSLASPLQEVASGGVIWVKTTYRKAVSLFSDNLKNQIEQTEAPGNRKLFELKRHVTEKVDETRHTAREKINRWFHKVEKPSTNEYPPKVVVEDISSEDIITDEL